MDDALCFGALQAIGVDMAHNVVAHQLLTGDGILVVDVVLVGFQLGKLLIGDCQALLLFSLGKRDPQLAPGAELVVVGEDILHLVRSIAGGERGNITVMLCHGKSPLLSYSLK